MHPSRHPGESFFQQTRVCHLPGARFRTGNSRKEAVGHRGLAALPQGTNPHRPTPPTPSPPLSPRMSVTEEFPSTKCAPYLPSGIPYGSPDTAGGQVGRQRQGQKTGADRGSPWSWSPSVWLWGSGWTPPIFALPRTPCHLDLFPGNQKCLGKDIK